MRLAMLGFLFRFKASVENSAAVEIRTATVRPDYPAGRLFRAMFDSAWYLERYSDAVDDLAKQESMTALDHYLTEGLADGRTGTPFFDAEWYVATYPDVPVAGRRTLYADALEHYLSTGYREGCN